MPARPLRSLVPLLFGSLIWLTFRGPMSRAAEAGPRAEAVDAYREGHYEEVIEKLSDQRDPELKYLLSRAHAELGAYEAALSALPEPPASWPAAVQNDLASLRLSWLAETGRCEEVAAHAGSTRSSQLTRFLARCAFTARDYGRVRELLKGAKDTQGRAMYARALAMSGEREEALSVLRVLHIERPANGEAKELDKLLFELDPDFRLDPSETLDRAEALIGVRHLETALSELDALKPFGDKKLEARRQHLRGEAFFRSRKHYPEAAKAFAKAAVRASATEAYDAFHAIRATSRAGRDREAIPRYRAFAKQYVKSSYAPDALYLAAWLSARIGKRSARAELARFANSDLAKREKKLLRDAEWDLGFLAFEEADRKAAALWLGRYRDDAAHELEAARASYWLGRNAQLARRKEEAGAHFRAALLADRHGYYAQLAAGRLRALGQAVPGPFEPDERAENLEPVEASLSPESAFYARLGLHADAADALQASLGKQVSRTERIALFLQTGDAAKTFSTASPLMSSVLSVSPERARWLWQALFPMPYLSAVTRETERRGLPRSLFYAHMQVESRYRPAVVSSADAIGLMQLLPSTARAVAKGLDLPASRRALKQPYVNVALGAAYLGQLVRSYHGQVPLAIAAYNAGSERVNGWFKKRQRVEFDRWVENIPIGQTRNYVRRVITAWARYELLAVPTQPWTLALPSHVGLGG